MAARGAPDSSSATELTARQATAVDLLVAGGTDTEVATALRVNRSTVYRWRKEPRFQAEANRRRKEVIGASLDRARSLLPKALQVIAQHLEEGNLRAAEIVLRTFGAALRDTHLIGPDDPERLVEAEELERRGKELFGGVPGVARARKGVEELGRASH